MNMKSSMNDRMIDNLTVISTMKSPFTFFLNLLFAITMSLLLSGVSKAGDEYSEEHIKHEISFLAQKLLDISGKDEYNVEWEARMKPYIGVCTSISEEGLAITCVTPGSQAEKGGLRTGDLVGEMNKKNFINADTKKTKKAYYEIVDSMKTGDVIKATVYRGKETVKLTLTVGSISSPGYSLQVRK